MEHSYTDDFDILNELHIDYVISFLSDDKKKEL